MQTRIETRGDREWRAALDRKAHAVDIATRSATTQAGHHIERRVKLYLRTYTHPRGTPTPSPPGGPPALVSGGLFRSVRTSLTQQIRRGVYRVRTGPTIEYSRIQELGGRAGRGHRSRLPKRPYQKPTTRRELATIHRIYRDRWAEAMRA